MKTNETHTPLPWNYGKNSQEVWCVGGGKTVAKVGYGNSPIPEFPGDKAEADANGEFIVIACNSHAALTEALKRLETAATNRDNTMGDPCRLLECKAELETAAKAARAAIAQAGAESEE